MFWRGLAAGLAALALAGTAQAVDLAKQESLRTVKQLADAAPAKPLHIVYLHGIRADAPGFSAEFRNAMCARFSGCAEVAVTTRYLDIGTAPGLSYLGEAVWNPTTWEKSRPFVRHHVFTRNGKRDLVVDEVSYWPLLLPLKCRYLVKRDADLPGPNDENIRVCANLPPKHPPRAKVPDEEQPERFRYPWIDPTTANELLKAHPKSGGGALINKTLKASLLTWGISDAVIVLGPVKDSVRNSVWCAFREIQAFDPSTAQDDPTPFPCAEGVASRAAADSQFVVITESLGSFVLLDAFAKATYVDDHSRPSTLATASTPSPSGQGSALKAIVQRSDNIYFMANQFPLLELGRLERSRAAQTADESDDSSIPNTMKRWAQTSGATQPDRQLVAFNDPSDILTYDVPDFCAGDPNCTTKFKNVYVRNGFTWFGLLAFPAKAHTGYRDNKDVLNAILGPAVKRAQ